MRGDMVVVLVATAIAQGCAVPVRAFNSRLDKSHRFILRVDRLTDTVVGRDIGLGSDSSAAASNDALVAYFNCICTVEQSRINGSVASARDADMRLKAIIGGLTGIV